MSPDREGFVDYSQFGRPRPVRGGIEARSRRGGFGVTWWSRRLVDAVEAHADSGRLSRGKSYARAGQVVALQVGAGRVTAEVQGSQPDPFEAEFVVRVLEPDIMQQLVDTVRATPGMLAEIVSGSLPTDLGPLLLPSSASELDFGCTCPDLGWPCKHVAAVVYLVAEHFDERPLDILTLRGVELETLIGTVRDAAPADSDDPYGERTLLPDLPTVAARPAIDDLDPVLLRRAIRSLSADEREVIAAVRELSALYGRMTADD